MLWTNKKCRLSYILPESVTLAYGVAIQLLRSAHRLIILIIRAKLFKKITFHRFKSSNGTDTNWMPLITSPVSVTLT
jgi:hypothetical protein